MTPPNVWTAKASRGATVSVLAVASSLTAAAPAEARPFSRTHESCQVVKPMSKSNALAAPQRKAPSRMRGLAQRAAERRARVQAERPDTPESLREAMRGFAALERDFASARRAANKHFH